MNAHLSALADHTRKWSPKINLVAKSTLAEVEGRHVRDSVQLEAFLPDLEAKIESVQRLVLEHAELSSDLEVFDSKILEALHSILANFSERKLYAGFDEQKKEPHC